MAMSSTSMDVTFTEWTYSCLMTEFSAQMYVAVKPKIYSGLKLTKFCEFTLQETGLRWNHLLGSREGTKDFTTKKAGYLTT